MFILLYSKCHLHSKWRANHAGGARQPYSILTRLSVVCSVAICSTVAGSILLSYILVSVPGSSSIQFPVYNPFDAVMEDIQGRDTVPRAHAQERPLRLMDLPTELHLHIASYLTYPDALALKHTSRYFYYLVYTGVHLKVDWLVERFELKLECPMEKCSFRTDESFCNWRIRRIMERRRRHLECRRTKGGCLVIGGKTCQMDLVPTWLKTKRWKTVLRHCEIWGAEGLYLCSRWSFFLNFGASSNPYAVLIIWLIFVVINLLWGLLSR